MFKLKYNINYLSLNAVIVDKTTVFSFYHPTHKQRHI